MSAVSPVQHDVDGEVAAEDVPAHVPGGIGLVEGSGDAGLRQGHLAPDVQEALGQTGRVAREEAALDQLVRIALHEQTVLVGARF
jgi:hypothetical protein